METKDNNNTDMDKNLYEDWEKSSRRGKVAMGLLIVIIGSLFLAREVGVILPEWLFSWQVIFIALGFVIGIKNAFRNMSWLIWVLIGTTFLLRNYFHELDFTHYMWPIVVIIFGLYIMLRPRRKCHGRRHWKKMHGYQHWKKYYTEAQPVNNNDHLQVEAVFGSVKKNVISKDFKGGEINCVFGGAEINLMQAEISSTVEIEINCVFAGVRLILPSNWKVRSELSAVLGSVEDKRMVIKDVVSDADNVLILKGSAVFGGIEIQSY